MIKKIISYVIIGVCTAFLSFLIGLYIINQLKIFNIDSKYNHGTKKCNNYCNNISNIEYKNNCFCEFNNE